jgi:hypothetical protein
VTGARTAAKQFQGSRRILNRQPSFIIFVGVMSTILKAGGGREEQEAGAGGRSVPPALAGGSNGQKAGGRSELPLVATVGILLLSFVIDKIACVGSQVLESSMKNEKWQMINGKSPGQMPTR